MCISESYKAIALWAASPRAGVRTFNQGNTADIRHTPLSPNTRFKEWEGGFNEAASAESRTTGDGDGSHLWSPVINWLGSPLSPVISL